LYCRFCGKELEEGATFCEYCGKRLGKKPGKKRLYEHSLTRLKVPKESRNPGIAAAIGFFLGWVFLGPVGYIYLGQWNWFWITIIVEIFVYPLTGIGPAYILLPIVFAVHQYDMAKDLNALLAEEREGNLAEEKTGEEEERGEDL
jgi:hypothetical protein